MLVSETIYVYTQHRKIQVNLPMASYIDFVLIFIFFATNTVRNILTNLFVSIPFIVEKVLWHVEGSEKNIRTGLVQC